VVAAEREITAAAACNDTAVAKSKKSGVSSCVPDMTEFVSVHFDEILTVKNRSQTVIQSDDTADTGILKNVLSILN